MTTFDAPSREVCTIRRIRTNTPLQALVTLNDPVFIEAAQGVARRIQSSSGDQPLSQKANQVLRLVLCRDASADEAERIVKLFEEMRTIYRERPEEALAIATDPLGPLPEGADLPTFAAWTVVANVLLNLDETISRP